MTDKDPLDEFFAAAQHAAPKPSDALLARILHDAGAEAAAREAKPAPGLRTPRSLRSVLSHIGGWPALAGLATATVAGVWIGTVQPLGMDSLNLLSNSMDLGSGSYLGYADLDWGEG